jgi:hypothetical protein
MTSQAQQNLLQRRDREAMLAFAAAINAGVTVQLLRDDCGDWILKGTMGHVYALAEFGQFHLYFFGAPYPYIDDNAGSHRWGRVKEKLHFCHLHQDGASEGFLRLDRLPTAAEGAVIRKALGIHKRRPPPTHAFKSSPTRGGENAPETAVTPAPALTHTTELEEVF